MKLIRKILAFTIVLSLLCAIPALAANSTTYTMPYYIEVDIANQVTTVFSTADNSIVRQMICTTGMGSLTPRGTFIMPVKKYDQDRQEWYYFPEFKIYAKYASRIYQGILFHSILFGHKGSETPTWASSHALGSKASHGCIRLRVPDAKWIAENCLAGTQVRIYDDGERNESLRKLLKAATYVAGEELTYDEFLAGVITLSKGANVDSVETMQAQLNALGYDCGKPDGDFGGRTETAVKAWQADYGYEEDGIVTPAMYKAIMACSTPEPTATPAPTPDVPVSEMAFDTAKITTESGLNVRKTPSTNGTWLGKIPNGSEVHILSYEDGWAKIDYNGTIAYVSQGFFEVTATREPTPSPEPTPTPEPTATPEPDWEAMGQEIGDAEGEAPVPIYDDDLAEDIIAEVRDISAKLNMRATPDPKGAVVARLSTGDRVILIGLTNDWAQVQLDDGTVGYVMFKYLNTEVVDVPELEEVVPEGKPATVTNEDGLWLTREAAEDGGKITKLDKGQKVYITEEAGAWVYVYARGFHGYLPKESIEEAAA